METLNLPSYTPKIKSTEGRAQIFDPLRNKFVALTPEEWVRQNFTNFLTAYKGYPPTLMANEVQLSLNGMSRRCDTVLYTQQLRPRMIIEYKAPHVNITQKVFDQICRYNIVMKVEYLIVSNGLQHYCCHVDYDNQTYSFLRDIPDYSSLWGEKTVSRSQRWLSWKQTGTLITINWTLIGTMPRRGRTSESARKGLGTEDADRRWFRCSIY